MKENKNNEVVKYLLENYDIKNANDIVVIGDSCGANMAVSLCMKLRDTAKPLPIPLFCFLFGVICLIRVGHIKKIAIVIHFMVFQKGFRTKKQKIKFIG